MEDLQDHALADQARVKTSTKKKSTATAKVYGKRSGDHLRPVHQGAARSRSPSTARRRRSTSTQKAGKPLKTSWTFKGALKSHTVVVTVLGTKATASKGTAVFLAALKVKA